MDIWDIQTEIAFNADPETFLNFCQVNRDFVALCHNPDFMREKLWKDFYIDSNTVEELSGVEWSCIDFI